MRVGLEKKNQRREWLRAQTPTVRVQIPALPDRSLET